MYAIVTSKLNIAGKDCTRRGNERYCDTVVRCIIISVRYVQVVVVNGKLILIGRVACPGVLIERLVGGGTNDVAIFFYLSGGSQGIIIGLNLNVYTDFGSNAS